MTEFCPFCLTNLKFVNEGSILHQMQCKNGYDALPLNDYESGSLLKLLLYFREHALPTPNGDWQEQIIAKLEQITKKAMP